MYYLFLGGMLRLRSERQQSQSDSKGFLFCEEWMIRLVSDDAKRGGEHH